MSTGHVDPETGLIGPDVEAGLIGPTSIFSTFFLVIIYHNHLVKINNLKISFYKFIKISTNFIYKYLVLDDDD